MKLLLPLLALVLATGPVQAATEAHQLARPDGSLIHYQLDYPAGPAAGLLVLAQGSGCSPAASSGNLAVIRAAFPGHVALIVEKIGITPDTETDGYADCPAEFLDHYTLSQRISDYELVLAHLRAQPDMPARLVLFGGSEGGLAMEALASRIRPDAAILLSGAVGATFGDMVRASVPPEGHATIDAGFAAARANPDSSTLFSGHTYRFWADSLDHRSADYIENTDTPFLLIHGGRDAAPIATLRPLLDRAAEIGLCHVTYWEFPAFDHGMSDPQGVSRLPQIARLAAAWAQEPLESCVGAADP